MEISGKREFDLLNKIGFVRMGGSREEAKAAGILMDEIKAMGIEPEYMPFEVDDADIVKAELEVLEPYNKKYVVTSYKLSENTPDDGLVGEFYYAENLTARNMAAAKGKIVLVNGFLNIDNYKKIKEAGAVAFITISGTMLETEEDSDLFTRTLRIPFIKIAGNMPGVNIRMTDAFEIVKKGATKVKLTSVNTPKKLTSHNVIATVPGTEHPEEVVVFGAHFDSVEFSTGVYDNGAGSVINMEILRHFAQHPPKRTVKFMWYGSEEMGLLGSKAWVATHEDELKDIVYMINVDVAGAVIGADTARLVASKAATEYTDAFMRRKGYAVDVKQDIYSSDSVPFADKGVPGINFMRFGTPGGAFIHNRYDVIDYLTAESLERTTQYIGDYAEEIINSVVFPFERVVPPEIVEKVDKYLSKKDLEKAENK